MTNPFRGNHSITQRLIDLSNKLGDDSEATLVIAALAAAWEHAAAAHLIEMARSDATGRIAAEFIKRTTDTMRTAQREAAETDAELQRLHERVVQTLHIATGSVGKARTVMEDVLKIYAEFDGSKENLKVGVKALATSVLAAVNPAIGLWASPLLDRLIRT